MPRKSNFFALLTFCFFLIQSCDSNTFYDNYKTLPEQWNKDNIVSFNFSAEDTISTYNMYVNLRNNNAYKYNNLFLIIAINYPNGKVEKDTLEYKMAAPNGEFLGTGFSDIKENKLWYKGFEQPFKFSEKGEYTVNVQQAMRHIGEVNGIVDLEGITEVGLKIEHSITK